MSGCLGNQSSVIAGKGGGEGRGELRIVGEHVVFRGNGGGTTYNQQRLKGGYRKSTARKEG